MIAKKFFSIIGIIVGASFIILGFLTISGELGGNATGTSYTKDIYDTGYAVFGTDFYTYSVNNTAKAAEAAEVTAYNVYSVANFLQTFLGTSSILIGIIVISCFGILLSTSRNNKILQSYNVFDGSNYNGNINIRFNEDNSEKSIYQSNSNQPHKEEQDNRGTISNPFHVHTDLYGDARCPKCGKTYFSAPHEMVKCTNCNSYLNVK